MLAYSCRKWPYDRHWRDQIQRLSLFQVTWLCIRPLNMVKSKMYFAIYIMDRKATTCVKAKLFLLGFVNPAALPLVRCYAIRLPRRVAGWVNYSMQRTESCPASTTSVISVCWRLMHYDVKISGVRIRTHNLWIRKRACYPLHHIGHSNTVLCRAEVGDCRLYRLLLLSKQIESPYRICVKLLGRIESSSIIWCGGLTTVVSAAPATERRLMHFESPVVHAIGIGIRTAVYAQVWRVRLSSTLPIALAIYQRVEALLTYRHACSWFHGSSFHNAWLATFWQMKEYLPERVSSISSSFHIKSLSMVYTELLVQQIYYSTDFHTNYTERSSEKVEYDYIKNLKGGRFLLVHCYIGWRDWQAGAFS